MKSWIALHLLITVTMAFCLAAQTATDLPSISIPLHIEKSIHARQHMRKLSSSVAMVEDRGHTIEVVGGMTTRHSNHGLAEDKDHDEDGLIYNVDYHGVTTHPSPYPYHPKP